MEKTDIKSEDKAEHINLIVRAETSEVYFKIKKSTTLERLMNAYCEKQGRSLNTTRFIYDGNRLDPKKTPLDYEMEDNDYIDVMVEQVGGYDDSKVGSRTSF